MNEQRCDFCARILFKNVSGTYKLCSKKCKTYFKNKSKIEIIDKAFQNTNINEWTQISNLINSINGYDKFEKIASISRLIYFKKKLILKNTNERNLKSEVKVKK